jgi:hypothetical protein
VGFLKSQQQKEKFYLLSLIKKIRSIWLLSKIKVRKTEQEARQIAQKKKKITIKNALTTEHSFL